MKRKNGKKQKQSDEDVVWSLEAEMYHEAIRKDKQRDCQGYIV